MTSIYSGHVSHSHLSQDKLSLDPETLRGNLPNVEIYYTKIYVMQALD